jgi:hypothetical protein
LDAQELWDGLLPIGPATDFLFFIPDSIAIALLGSLPG